MLCRAAQVGGDAVAVLLPVLPLPVVAPPVRPSEGAVAVLQVVGVAADVDRAVRPIHAPPSVHVARLPTPAVHTAVGEGVPALAVHLVVEEVALVPGPGPRGVDALPVLAAVAELADVLRAVGPRLPAVALLCVVPPIALVDPAVHVNVPAVPVCLVSLPMALVGAATRGDEGPLAVGHAVLELAQVALAIGSGEKTFAVPAPIQPLAPVPRAALDLRLRALYHLPVVSDGRCPGGHRRVGTGVDAAGRLGGGNTQQGPGEQDRLRGVHLPHAAGLVVGVEGLRRVLVRAAQALKRHEQKRHDNLRWPLPTGAATCGRIMLCLA
mmetsp:Transcript_61552/g.172210  ORF Transcript_61552/g.172210 Transcript_61552/m.172210 type:complete len:324 (-) Transcript_61552:19-990(-)